MRERSYFASLARSGRDNFAALRAPRPLWQPRSEEAERNRQDIADALESVSEEPATAAFAPASPAAPARAASLFPTGNKRDSLPVPEPMRPPSPASPPVSLPARSALVPREDAFPNASAEVPDNRTLPARSALSAVLPLPVDEVLHGEGTAPTPSRPTIAPFQLQRAMPEQEAQTASPEPPLAPRRNSPAVRRSIASQSEAVSFRETRKESLPKPAENAVLTPPAPNRQPLSPRADDAGGTAVHIGSIDVQIVPLHTPTPPPPVLPPSAPTASPASPAASPLARGFLSSWGLRQG